MNWICICVCVGRGTRRAVGTEENVSRIPAVLPLSLLFSPSLRASVRDPPSAREETHRHTPPHSADTDGRILLPSCVFLSSLDIFFSLFLWASHSTPHPTLTVFASNSPRGILMLFFFRVRSFSFYKDFNTQTHPHSRGPWTLVNFKSSSFVNLPETQKKKKKKNYYYYVTLIVHTVNKWYKRKGKIKKLMGKL